MGWPNNPRPAKSLVVLRDQVNAKYPNRSTASDGMIGDAAHQAEGSASDHNPWLNDSRGVGVVTAFDITHDPDHGLDIDQFSDILADGKDARIKYLIANNKILVASDGWFWQAYGGIDPHTNHIHISVNTDNYDNETPWGLEGEDMKITRVMFNFTWRGFFDEEPPEKEIKYWVGRSDAIEWENYLEGLYKQNEQRRYKANNYDKDVAAAAKGNVKATTLTPGLYKIN